MMDLKQEMKERCAYIEQALEQAVPEQKDFPPVIFEAMRYSLLAGGKRLRPMMVLAACEAVGGKKEDALPFACALEMIHTYSLIHDDLPAMDNDEYRRGRKTTWNVYGEGMAVLAGDALLNKAFETAAEAFSMIGEAADIAARYAAVAKALQILANKAGIYGMIGGQCADICAEELPADHVTKELLWYIHKNKTAALIEAALMIGAVLAGAPDEAVKKLEQAAENIGIAFQIQDDILDVTSSLEVLGKPVGSDEKNHKVTYVRLNGLEQSKKDVEALSEEALKILSSFDRRNEFLEDLVRALITREK